MFTDNALTRLLGTRYPILGGTMMDLSLAPFVTAICEAGALGVIASVIYKDYDHFRADLKAVADATDQPFAVNINLFPMMEKLDNLRYLEIMAEQGVKIVETSGFAPPEDLLARFKEYGFTWLHKCVGVRYAKKAAQLGADAVIVVGYENGGATGNLNVTTLVLVPRTVDEVSVPVVGGGGVMDSRTFLAVMALGASGVIVGTRLMLSEECPIHPDLKQALVQANELDTDIIMRSVGFAHRIWMNSRAREAQRIEQSGGGIAELYPHISGEAAREMYQTGDLDAGTVSCSQGIALAKQIKPVKDIIAEMVSGAEALVAALGR
jgi:nitronate monooxygenase